MARRPLILVAAVGLLLSGLLPAAFAQDDALELQIDAIDDSAHPEVGVSVELPPEMHGSQLDADAFTITENGDERDLSIESAETQPFEIMLAIDTSGSMGTEPMAAARDAAIAFVDEMPAGTQIGVLEFASETDLVVAPTDDHDAVAEAIAGLESQGFTALYNGIADSLDALGDSSRQTVIVLSDGGDNPSDQLEDPLSLDQVITRIEDSPATLHTLELVTTDTEPEILQQLADAGDGTATSAEDLDALEDVYTALADQLTNTYELSYESEVGGDVEVTVTAQDGDTVASATQTVALPEIEEPEPEETEVAFTPPPVTPPETQILSAGLLGTQWAMIGGVVLFYLALFTLVLTIFAPSQGRTQLAGAAGGWSWRRPELSNLAERATLLAERGLQGHNRARRLNTALERAGIALRPGEFVVLALSAAIVAFAVVYVFANWIVATLVALAAYPISRLVLSVLASRRRDRFAEQLDDTLQLLAGSLRAGYGLTQAIDTVSREAQSPTAEEFKRIVVEMRLGRSSTEALEAAARRIDSEDFWWVVHAMEIHREVGGDLAEVLDNVGGTIRERNHVRGQVKALSAEGRLSGVILVALPFVVGGAVFLLNPGYIEELFTNTIGIFMVVFASILMVIGIIWIRRAVRLVF